MPHGDMTCQELVSLVTDYLEGALTPSERARFEAHLAECDGCGEYLDQMRTTIRLVGELGDDAISPVRHADLLAAFRSWRRD